MKERPILFSAPMVRAILGGTKTQTRRIVKLPHQNPLGQWEPITIGGPNGGRTAEGSTIPEQGAIWHTRTGDTMLCPYGMPSDRLWLRETWMPDAPRDGSWPDVEFFGCKGAPLDLIPERFRKPEHCLFRSTWNGSELVGWKPSIHMPRWASRILLEVTGVRVERLQDISETDAIAEGIEPNWIGDLSVGPNGFGGQGWVPDCGWRHYTNSIDGDPAYTPIESYRSLWESINGAGSWEANPWVWVIEFRRVDQRAAA